MTTYAAVLSTLLATFAVQEERSIVDWLIVRGESELVAPMSYRKLADVYLPTFTTRIVGAGDADVQPAASRVVIGTPGDHELVEELARSLGLTWKDGNAHFQGDVYGPGTGFVLVDADPDGEGSLSLVTGIDARSLFNCFTVTLSIVEPGYTVLQRQAKLASGLLVPGVDRSRVIVIRLDADFERLVNETEGWPRGDRELRVARGLAGFGHVFQALNGGRADVLPSVKAALIDTQGSVKAARRVFGGRDVTAEVLAIFERCRVALGGVDGLAPVVYVVIDPSSGTNGRSFGADPVSGRPQLVLNLAVLASAGNFETVSLHECLHTFQSFAGERAVDRGMREGTATLGTQLVDPSISDAEALLWTEAEFAAAEQRQDALIAGFKQIAASTDAGRLRSWFDLGATFADVPGAPSRSGYYVCWLACRAWRKAHPSSTLVDLFDASADELLAALH